MAMIMPQGIPASDLEAIVRFYESDFDSSVPEPTRRGAAVLNAVTSGEKPMLSRVLIGRFVEGEAPARNSKDGAREHVDALYGEKGPTGRWGVVVEDYENPDDAYLVGVPL